MVQISDYNSTVTPTWCPGCGSWSIFTALKQSLVTQNIPPDGVLMVFDIGCSGNMADFVSTYAIHTLHGRVLPTAVGAYVANHEFPVVAVGGDGGVYGEGVEHFIEACRANFNITLLVHNNGLYSLTTGQRSPVAQKGLETKSTPQGVIELPFRPLETAILHDASFVARGFVGDLPQLTGLITQAMQHPGFSVVDILQPCPTFNKDRTFTWYRDRIVAVEAPAKTIPSEALAILEKDDETISTGVIYTSSRPAYHTFLPQMQSPLLNQSIETISIEDIIKDYS